MAEGNAGVFDYDAIRKVLSDRGYRAIYATEENRPVAPALDRCPEAYMCPLTCSVDGVVRPHCRVHKVTSAGSSP